MKLIFLNKKLVRRWRQTTRNRRAVQKRETRFVVAFQMRTADRGPRTADHRLRTA
jgi:hypothetical protein